MKRNLALTTVTVFSILGGMEVHAACTAGNPNANISEATPTAGFTDNLNGTVTHDLTGLTWKQCIQGRSGAGCASGSNLVVTWGTALQSAVSDTTAGFDDWRVPNSKELLSIIEPCGVSPAINTAVFPNTPNGNHWTSTTSALDPVRAWYVDFGQGDANADFLKTSMYYTRLVRGGTQAVDAFDGFAPILSSVGTSGLSVSGGTLSATSDVAATGYWLVVAQGSVAPTSAEIKAGVDYGSETVVVSGNDTMLSATSKNFTMSTLSASTAYDAYVMAYEATNKASSMPSKVSFTTSAPADTTPDAFAYTDQTTVGLSSLTVSNAITVARINTASAFSVTEGENSINGGSYTSSGGPVDNGDTVRVRATSSSADLTTVNVVLTIGGVSDTFAITTADFTPDAFSFTDQTGVALNTVIASNSVTVSGITGASAVSVSSGEYSINGGTYTSTAGNINNNDTVSVRGTSSSSADTAVNVVLAVGGVSDTFSITTEASETGGSAGSGSAGGSSSAAAQSTSSGGSGAFGVWGVLGLFISLLLARCRLK